MHNYFDSQPTTISHSTWKQYMLPLGHRNCINSLSKHGENPILSSNKNGYKAFAISQFANEEVSFWPGLVFLFLMHLWSISYYGCHLKPLLLLDLWITNAYNFIFYSFFMVMWFQKNKHKGLGPRNHCYILLLFFVNFMTCTLIFWK